MTEPLLTISAFARAVDLAPSTLRYYDDAGLLPPAEVDAHTGYRYYTPALERRAHLIRRMREVGVPVETMRKVVEGPPDHAAELLHEVAARAAETARRTASTVSEVLTSLRAEGNASAPTVVAVDGPELAAALRRVVCAADTAPDSPLGVVLVDITDDGLNVVATNRYWLALWSLPPVDSTGFTPRRIAIPRSDVDEFARWLSRRETVRFSASGESTAVSDGTEFSVPTTEDRFPAYQLVLDSQPPQRGRATVDRALLLAAVSDQPSPLRLVIGGDQATVQAPGTRDDTHLHAMTTGEPITIGFSASLLTSVLDIMVGSDITLSYVAPDQAVCVTSADQLRLTAMVMPTKLP